MRDHGTIFINTCTIHKFQFLCLCECEMSNWIIIESGTKMYTYYWFCIINGLFWHSNDVFIQAHIETIKNFFLKKIVSQYVYVVNLKPTVMTLPFGVNIDIHDAVRYKDMMEYGLGPNKEILTFGFRKSEPVRIMWTLITSHIAWDDVFALNWRVSK